MKKSIFAIMLMATVISCKNQEASNNTKDSIKPKTIENVEGISDLNIKNENHELKKGLSNVERRADPKTDIKNLVQLCKIRNGMLMFPNSKSAEQYAKKIEYFNSDELDMLEKEMDFISLRSYHIKESSSEDIDDSEYDKKRLADPNLEAVLNSKGEFAIADTIFTFTNSKTTKKIYNGKEFFSEEFTYDKSIQNKTNQYCGNLRTACEKLLGGGRKVVGEKWIRNSLWKSIGSKTIHYKKNRRGKFKRRNTDEIHLYIDQWHELCFTSPYLVPNLTCISDDYKMESNAKKVKKTYELIINLPGKICVRKFGRVHHWNDQNWNSDCHTEPWF